MTSDELNAPDDEMLMISVTLRKMIRAWTEAAMERVQYWEPAPYDPEWNG